MVCHGLIKPEPFSHTPLFSLISIVLQRIELQKPFEAYFQADK